MSEPEAEVPFEEPGEAQPEEGEQPSEVPDGVDPDTGELLEETETADVEPEDSGDEQRRRELIAEREQAEQEAAQAEADAAKLMKALNRAAENYAKKIVDLFEGDLTGWQPSPLCADAPPGFRTIGMPSPENLALTKVAIGEDPDPPLEADPYSRECDKCGGHGKVLTGSHVTGQKAAQCLDCKGAGWLAVGPERSLGYTPPPNGSPAPVEPVAPGAPPVPLQTDHPRTPAEEELRQMGAIVVWPPQPPDMSKLGV